MAVDAIKQLEVAVGKAELSGNPACSGFSEQYNKALTDMQSNFVSVAEAESRMGEANVEPNYVALVGHVAVIRGTMRQMCGD
jgi:hypothetical protein